MPHRFVNVLVYYGLWLGVSRLGTDLHLTQVIFRSSCLCCPTVGDSVRADFWRLEGSAVCSYSPCQQVVKPVLLMQEVRKARIAAAI